MKFAGLSIRIRPSSSRKVISKAQDRDSRALPYRNRNDRIIRQRAGRSIATQKM